MPTPMQRDDDSLRPHFVTVHKVLRTFNTNKMDITGIHDMDEARETSTHQYKLAERPTCSRFLYTQTL